MRCDERISAGVVKEKWRSEGRIAEGEVNSSEKMKLKREETADPEGNSSRGSPKNHVWGGSITKKDDPGERREREKIGNKFYPRKKSQRLVLAQFHVQYKVRYTGRLHVSVSN
jgi:hypothetical protein